MSQLWLGGVSSRGAGDLAFDRRPRLREIGLRLKEKGGHTVAVRRGERGCCRSRAPQRSSFAGITGQLKSRGSIQLGLIGSRGEFLSRLIALYSRVPCAAGPRLFHPYLDARASFANEKLSPACRAEDKRAASLSSTFTPSHPPLSLINPFFIKR